LLCEESVTELLRPLQVAVQIPQHVWERNEGLNALIPRERLKRGRELTALEGRMGRILQPPRSLDDLERVGRSGKNLPEQWVGVQRDWRGELVKLRWLQQISARCGHRLHRRGLRAEGTGRG
jgi:hypothetical protein